MLKHLLSHWKAHRRKPALLPEDADIQINDPSRVNPLYEDSEGSVTSSHPRSEIDSPDIEDTQGGDINLDLVDISVPSKDNSESADAKHAEEAIDHINRVLDNAFDGESLKSIDHTKSELGPDKELTDSTPVEQEVKNDLPQAITQLIKQASITNTQQIEASSSRTKTREKPHSSLGEIVNQVVSDTTHNEPTQSENIKNTLEENKKENEMVPGTSLKTQQSSEQFATPSTSEIKNDSNSNFPRKVPITESEAKINTNLKTRAIDELIKKFQGRTDGDGPSIQTISSFLHSHNRKEIPKVKSPLFKTEVKNSEPDNGGKKESLATIFKFPPPPPLEPVKNNSGDTKVGPKETKTESIKPVSLIEDNSTKKEGTTRSDSSLSRNITVSSRDVEKATKTEDNQSKAKSKLDSKKDEVEKSSAANKLFSPNLSKDTPTNTIAPKKETNLLTDVVQVPSKNANTAEKSPVISPPDTKQSEQSSSSANDNVADVIKKDSKVLSIGSKQKIEKQTRNFKKQTDSVAASATPPNEKSKTSSLKKTDTSQKETDQSKSQSEDSGITRGDQVYSEVSPEDPKPGGQTEKDDVPPSPPKTKHPKEKRMLHTRGKSCKRCKRSRDDNSSLKRGQCDDYYDIVTGKRRQLRTPHSESWASDLSWEEKELIRRLRRSRRGTLRSNAPSTKSKHSRTHEKGHFHRHHAARRSLSDDSTFNSSTLCSCDECWLFLVKDYAYGRASLRAMSLNQVLCTCRPIRPDFLGRKVKFRSDTIHEGSQSGRTSATPTIPEEPTTKKEDSGDTPTSDSNLSSSSQGGVLPTAKTNGKTDKKSKLSKETYRLVSPWELEEWDLAMRRHLLIKRRKRARYMGFMALAMVVFIGLIVAILMVYLRRKVL